MKGPFEWLFGSTPTKDGTFVDRDKNGNEKRMTRKGGKVTTVYVPKGGGAKFRNEQAMQDYLRRGGSGR